MSKRIEEPQQSAENILPIEQVSEKKVKSFIKKDKIKSLTKDAPVYHIIWRDAFSISV